MENTIIWAPELTRVSYTDPYSEIVRVGLAFGWTDQDYSYVLVNVNGNVFVCEARDLEMVNKSR